MDKERLDLRIIDTVFNPDLYGNEAQPRVPKNGTLEVRYHKSGGASLYKVWLFLAGNDLPFVESATYQLHETFPDPVRTATRALGNPDCRIVIWTWGVFQVNATILDKTGVTYALSQQLNFGELLNQYGGQIKYIEENPDANRGAKLVR